MAGKGRPRDSLSGSFRDPHFQLVVVHDVTLRSKTTRLSLFLLETPCPPPALPQAWLRLSEGMGTFRED